MHPDEFTSFDASFPTYDDCFNSAGGYHYDLHDDCAVDPFLESFDYGTTDLQAIAIRNAREAGEQIQAQALAAMQVDEQAAAVSWVQAVVRGPEPAYFAGAPAVIKGPERWTLATQLSTALAAEIGYQLDERDDDCWHHPSDREWKHLPTDRIYAYNAAYERFCKLVGKKLPAAAPLSEDELYEAEVHAQMLRTERELEPSAVERMLGWVRLKRAQLLH
ncbi:hypothetical protein [Roseateles puraquae]|uniref:Uncharacterized protein n=1 Tax=Roseateles puraquae TaxID=431059 RepID=A0A254N1T6_9BURK|nr:hypothetical protein [Roseateles puraquae]MDG0853060.1 hypothetical protein [Roseateles puraquae]OWR02179.1 hypothetical protein CDO81_20790 [Roseateles puraquae]